MSDVLHRHAVLAQKLDLERKYAEQQIDRSTQRFDPTRSPGPHGRAHVVHGLDTGIAQLSLQTEIEIGCVDSDKAVRWILSPALRQTPAQAQQARQMPNDLGQAHDGQRIHGNPAIQTFRLHPLAPDAFEVDVRTLGP